MVGFCASFGAKYFNGYARDSKNDNSGKWSVGAINNLKKQRNNLKDIQFYNKDFRDIDISKLNNYVIYCDIPYRNTTSYCSKDFPYDYFYQWVLDLSKNNTVLISEYWMPDDFKYIWQREIKTLLDSNKTKNNKRVEKLFIVK